jgi:cytochrome P450
MEGMRSPNYYKCPEEFNPGRWLETIDKDHEEKSERLEDLAWLPFGIGPRSCVGMRMAILEAKLFLHSVFSRYTVKPHSESKLQLELHGNPTLRPAKPLQLLFIVRKK